MLHVFASGFAIYQYLVNVSTTAKGINKISQKVGEESIETIIEAIADNDLPFMEEAADLFFHYLILLKSKGKSLEDVLLILEDRKRG